MSQLTEKQQYWSEQLLQADSFDGSLAQYAQAQNIPAQSLYRWRSYFRQTTTTKTVFTQVVSVPVPSYCLELNRGDFQLHFTRWPSPQWLAEFITTSDSP